MSKSRRVILRIAALLVFPALFIVQPAVAMEAPPSVTVRYHDLNLNNPEGIATLYKRIHDAAIEVCKPLKGPLVADRIFWITWDECFDPAIANAVKAVNNENLSAYHLQHTRRWKRLEAADAPATMARQ